MVAAEAISTARLELLPVQPEHADELAAALADPALHTFIGGSPATAAQLRDRYARWQAGSPDPAVSWCNWALRLRAEDRLVGTVQATIGPAESSGPEGSRVAEIAWVVGTAWQGRGIATEAGRALVRWLGRQQVTSVIAHVHPDHRASAGVAAAAGLVATDERQDGEVRWQSPPESRS